MDPSKLNDDQKRSVKNLPTLEAVQKELGEVKAAIEASVLLEMNWLCSEYFTGLRS